MKYRYFQHIDTHIEAYVDAESEEEAYEMAVAKVVDMHGDEYNSQIIENAEPGEDTIELVEPLGGVSLGPV
ncbi:hypothetical protein ES708_21470 [subsurface metagenome]